MDLRRKKTALSTLHHTHPIPDFREPVIRNGSHSP